MMTAKAEGDIVSDQAWDMLFDELLAAREELVRRVREAVRDQLPVYRMIPDQVHAVDMGVEIEWVLRSARSGRKATVDREPAELVAIGEARAHQGIPVDDMLGSWRIAIQIILGYAREVGKRLGIEDVRLLDFLQAALAWSDIAMIAVASAHRKTELGIAVADETRRVAFVRGALFGTVPNTQLRIQAEAYGLDPTGEFVAVRARPSEVVSAHKLQQVLDIDTRRQRRRGLTALVDGDIAGFLSVSEPPPENIEAVVGFGPPRRLENLAESHRLAVRALSTAQAFGLQGTYDIASLGLRAAVAMDKDVGELLRKRYLEPLEASGSASELIATLRQYLACGMNVRTTARRLFVHENTVRYRLARFEELTEARLLDTEVLTEIWWVLQLSAMRL